MHPRAAEPEPAARRQRPEAFRDVLVVALTLTTGAVDAICFLHLGNVFSSVITGNMVLLGVATGMLSPTLATHSGVALAGYAAGVAVGAPVAGRGKGAGEVWPARVTLALVAELGVLAGFSAGWEAAGGRPDGLVQLILVAVLAAAMGMQSAAVRQLGQMSTTYLTSTLTGVVAGLVTAGKPEGRWRSVGVLAAIVAGAAAGAAVARQAPAWAPAALLVPLLAAVIAAAARFGVPPAGAGNGRRADSP